MHRIFQNYLSEGVSFSPLIWPVYLDLSLRVEDARKRMRENKSRGSLLSFIAVSAALDCPPLREDDIVELDSALHQTVTRHIDGDWLEATLAGSFKVGTIASYKAKDEALTGRFGDPEESIQREVYNSRTGIFRDTQIGPVHFEEVGFEKGTDAISLVYGVNAYCSCAAIGNFDEVRANKLRKQGNPDVNAYVTYDLSKLKSAFREILAERPDFGNFSVFGRDVVYGQKNRYWEVEEHFHHKEDREPIAIFLDAAFVKANAYQHEEEYRLLIIDPSAAGRLPHDTKPLFLDDPRIAAAVVASGRF